MSPLPRPNGRLFVPLLAVVALASAPSPLHAQARFAPRVQAIRFWSFGDVTRIAIQTDGGYRLAHQQNDSPARVFFDLTGLEPPASARHGYETIAVNDRRVRQIRVAPLNSAATRIVFDLESPAEIVYSQLVNPDRLMIEIRPKSEPIRSLVLTHSTTGSRRLDEVAVAEPTPPPSSIAPPPSRVPAARAVISDAPRIPVTTRPDPLPIEHVAMSTVPLATPPKITIPAPALKPLPGDTSLVRVFGLKMSKVVIDAGHGGHDTGTIGPDGMLEKDLVLDVALRLGALIEKNMGAQVVYTRSEDVFIPLEERTRIANDQKADLFISIHANSSPESHATGVETYYFNFSSDKAGLDLATRENAMSTSSISDLNDLLHRAVLQTKMEESREFAQAVQTSLWGQSVKMNSQSKNRGVRQAPFVVLIGATMPSILAEVGFVSNPHDERLMRRSDQRQKIAEALFKGVSAYSNSLSHLQLARASAH